MSCHRASSLPRPAALAVALALSLAAAASAANHSVMATAELTFSPKTITINAGDSITWINTSGLMHNVYADDGSFRCANGCDGDGHGGNGDPAEMWTFTRTFSQVGTINYECQVHGQTYGMVGTIVVQGASPPPAGKLSFSASTYSIAENAGSIPITVNRAGGSAGAVAVDYATSDGTGTAGKNYTATSGTLNWASGDATAKTFNVAVLDDGVADGNHTVNLALTAPQGGAGLGSPATAVLTVTNTDGGSGGPPAAPSNLTAASSGTTSIQLSWTSNSTNETGFRVQSKTLDGSPFQDVLPLAPAGSTSYAVTGLQPATGYGFQVRAENGAGNSAYTPEADAATDTTPAPCVADANTLCLGGRFKVSVAFVSGAGSGNGTTVPLTGNPDSGLFYFFSSSNIEMLIKVINGCALSNTYWVFFAATTNVQFTVTVVDTVAGKTKVYFNQLNQAAPPVQDTSAFATCP
ncbi:MAG TPA: Calx-beta domain-containing protein [Thermoanaerobaculia bacterium]|jgi:plastocyanin|nr:Calx-beta domain-containing protein [Thermoanaerobaculia bacterium]